jgi:iodotyrosine deiodinase
MENRIPVAQFYQEYPPDEMRRRVSSFCSEMLRRRSVRDFSSRVVPHEVITDCLRVGASAPSGANLQPWHFVVVTDPVVKKKIRDAAEKEELQFYDGRAPAEWLASLAPLSTDEHKPFLEEAPVLVVIFAEAYRLLEGGRQAKNYFVSESVGIATGMLIAALHHAGLVMLTHTPSPMGFLNEILGRAHNERPFLLLVVGYPKAGATVPSIEKKALKDVVTCI